MDFVGKKKWELSEHIELAEEIAYRISLFLKKQARLNENKIKDNEDKFLKKWNIE